jgi:sulfur-carrier protein
MRIARFRGLYLRERAYDAPMTVVCVRGPLRKLAGGRAEHELEGATVIEVLRALERRHPDLSGWILDEPGRIRRHISVFINGERQSETAAVRSGDRIEVVPAITGG